MPVPMRRRYLLGFVLAAAILATVGLSIMLATRQFQNDAAAVAHTYEVIGRIEQVRAAVLDAISSQRSYLLTGQAPYRKAHDDERERVRRAVLALSVLVKDNPDQTRRASDLNIDITRRLEYSARGIEIYESLGLEAARTYTIDNPGLTLGRIIGQQLDAMRQAEDVLLAGRRKASAASARALLGLGALGIPLSLLIIGTIYVLLSREIRERLAAERTAGTLNQRLSSSVLGLERVSAELRELSNYASLLQSCQNIPEALDVARRALSLMLPQCGGTVYLLRASADYAEAEASWGRHHAASGPLLAADDCWCLRRAQPHVVDDLRQGLSCSHVEAPVDGEAAVATACIPLMAQGVQLGMLFLSAAGPGPIPHLSIAITAAEQFSLTLANLRLKETLRHQSIRDPLTGLYNRRYLEESLARELARCERRGLSLAVMMLDLDHFKALNDRYGHEGGDAVLTAFGKVLQSACREEDIACRYGGEEFTLILPEIDGDTAARRAEQVRATVEAMSVRHLHHNVHDVTCSIGLAMYPRHATSDAMLLRVADEALYAAKHAGRNRVQVARVVAQG